MVTIRNKNQSTQQVECSAEHSNSKFECSGLNILPRRGGAAKMTNQKAKLRDKKNSEGFTLTEILVVIAVFCIVMGAVIGIFISAIRVQRYYLASQKLLDQTSYITEYMSRSIRMAKKRLDSPPAGCETIPNGCNYENPNGENSIKFIRVIKESGVTRKICQEFYLSGHQIYQKIDGVATALTSDDIHMNHLKFEPHGWCQEDELQPRVTIYIDGEVENLNPSPSIKIQTTVSQRDLDVTE